jgi:hypothetical protein
MPSTPEPLSDAEYATLLRAVCHYERDLEQHIADRPVTLDGHRHDPIDTIWLVRLLELREAWSKVSEAYWSAADTDAL